MVIGLLTPYFPDQNTQNSGIANHYKLLSESLEDLGHTVIVIHIRPVYKGENAGCKTTKQGLLTTLITHRVSLPKILERYLSGKWSILEFLIRIKSMYLTYRITGKLIEKHQINIIEATSYFSLTYFLKFRKNRVPIVHRVSTTFSQMMDSYYGFKSRFFELIGRLEINLIKKSTYLITHAHNHALELENLYGIDHRNFFIIPHGVKLPSTNKLNIVQKPFKQILYVGRLEYRKGTDVLLNSIPLVLSRHPNVLFELIGVDTSNYEVDFRKLHSDEVNKSVIFSGQSEDSYLKSAYSNCDIFVAPSRYESFGLIYIEAMSFGKPVVACQVGGVPEIVINNLNGLFCELENYVDLAEKILLLLQNDKQRIKMGQNAKKTVKEKFTSQILASNSADYYKKVIDQHG